MIERIVTPPLAANAYLVLDEKKALIDVGGDFKFIYNVLIKKFNLKSLDYIILTHTHFDHAAATADLKKAMGASVILHKLEYKFAVSQNFSASFFGINFPPFQADVLVDEGDSINLGEINLEVVHTPGHTPGSICLYERDKKIMFTGDTVFPDGGFGRVDFPGGDAHQLVRSLEKLTKFDVDVMYPGHDEPVRNAKEHIKMAYKIAKMFL